MPRSGARTGGGGRRSGSSSLWTVACSVIHVDSGLFCYSCGQWLVWLVHARVLICCFIGALSASIYGLKFIENIVAFISWPLVVVVYILTEVSGLRPFSSIAVCVGSFPYTHLFPVCFRSRSSRS
jgi:hypothetical protein